MQESRYIGKPGSSLMLDPGSPAIQLAPTRNLQIAHQVTHYLRGINIVDTLYHAIHHLNP